MQNNGLPFSKIFIFVNLVKGFVVVEHLNKYTYPNIRAHTEYEQIIS